VPDSAPFLFISAGREKEKKKKKQGDEKRERGERGRKAQQLSKDGA